MDVYKFVRNNPNIDIKYEITNSFIKIHEYNTQTRLLTDTYEFCNFDDLDIIITADIFSIKQRIKRPENKLTLKIEELPKTNHETPQDINLNDVVNDDPNKVIEESEEKPTINNQTTDKTTDKINDEANRIITHNDKVLINDKIEKLREIYNTCVDLFSNLLKKQNGLPREKYFRLQKKISEYSYLTDIDVSRFKTHNEIKKEYFPQSKNTIICELDNTLKELDNIKKELSNSTDVSYPVCTIKLSSMNNGLNCKLSNKYSINSHRKYISVELGQLKYVSESIRKITAELFDYYDDGTKNFNTFKTNVMQQIEDVSFDINNNNLEVQVCDLAQFQDLQFMKYIIFVLNDEIYTIGEDFRQTSKVSTLQLDYPIKTYTLEKIRQSLDKSYNGGRHIGNNLFWKTFTKDIISTDNKLFVLTLTPTGYIIVYHMKQE